MQKVVFSDGGKHPFIETEIGDSKQHFYVGGRVQFGPADNSNPWVNLDIFTITRIVSPTEIEVVADGYVEQIVNLEEAEIRVFEVPDEIRSEEMSTAHIAPYHIEDDYGYADEDYFWNYWQASQAAELFTEDKEHDCQLQNAYSNDVEYFEYNADEEDESEDEESDD